jgi:hypothetical protein
MQSPLDPGRVPERSPMVEDLEGRARPNLGTLEECQKSAVPGHTEAFWQDLWDARLGTGPRAMRVTQRESL